MPTRGEGLFLRPYAQTGGRIKPRRSDLDLTTQVVASAEQPQHIPYTGRHRQTALFPEIRTILDLATRPVAIAELAARMTLPLISIQILVDDLVDDGRLTIIPALHTGNVDEWRSLLLRVRDGLLNA